jgi:hypothetical protein
VKRWRREQGAERIQDEAQQLVESVAKARRRFDEACDTKQGSLARDFGGALRNAAAAFATFIDKENIMGDRPQIVTEERGMDLMEIERAMRQIRELTEGPVVDAEVVENALPEVRSERDTDSAGIGQPSRDGRPGHRCQSRTRPVWHSSEYGMDRVMHPGVGALVLKVPTFFAVVPQQQSMPPS